jgi:hypothetical protein
MFYQAIANEEIGAAPLAGGDEHAPTCAQPLVDLPLELIEREIESLAAQINAGSARWLELVAEFDRRQGWADTGCRSTSEWVAWRCALTSRTAGEHVRVARALPKLPLIRAAFASGELSYSKVRALTRVADQDSEAALCELAPPRDRGPARAHRPGGATSDGGGGRRGPAPKLRALGLGRFRPAACASRPSSRPRTER